MLIEFLFWRLKTRRPSRDSFETQRRYMAEIHRCDRSSAKLNSGTWGHEVLNLRAHRDNTGKDTDPNKGVDLVLNPPD